MIQFIETNICFYASQNMENYSLLFWKVVLLGSPGRGWCEGFHGLNPFGRQDAAREGIFLGENHG